MFKKKISIIATIAIMSSVLVACSNTNPKKENVNAKEESVTNNNIDSSEEKIPVINNNLKFKSYEELTKFYTKSSEEITKFLNSNNIEHNISSNNAFIISQNSQYQKFNKDYKEVFISDTNVNFNDGVGFYEIIVDKEFHIDDKPTMDDNYINLMKEIYKSFIPKSTDSDFESEFNRIVEECQTTGYTTGISEEAALINMDATFDDNTIRVFLKAKKPIEVTPMPEITNEYETVSDFENKEYEVISHEYLPIDESNDKYIYAYYYTNSSDESFDEETNIYLNGITNDMRFEKDIESSQYSSASGRKIVFNDEMKSYLVKGLDKFKEVTGEDVTEYISIEQLAKEIETKLFRTCSVREEESCYQPDISETLPIPGNNEFRVVSESMFDDSLYDDILDIDVYEQHIVNNDTVYDISIGIYRPVIAEGITRK